MHRWGKIALLAGLLCNLDRAGECEGLTAAADTTSDHRNQCPSKTVATL
jgi:hypothetical protein